MLDLIIEKNYVRELNIVKKLLDVNDWLSISELSKMNKVVLRTVIQDIDSIKENLPKDWDIILKDSRVKIYKTAQSNYVNIYSTYLKKSFSYQVLRGFFVGKNNSLISLCNDLHVSHSHFYKKIQKVQMLLPKGVHFNLEKLCLEGDEIQIRFIYFNLISVTDCITDFGFTETSFLCIEKNIKEVTESLKIELSDVGKKYCKYWIGICYKRNKNYVDINKLVYRNPIESCLNKIYSSSSSILENNMVGESRMHSLGFYFQPIKYSGRAKNNFLNFYEKNFELFSLVEGITKFLKKNKRKENSQLKLYLVDIFMSDLILKNSPYFKKSSEKNNLDRLNQELYSLLKDYFHKVEINEEVFISDDKKERFLKGVVCFFNPLLTCLLQNEKITIEVSLSQGIEIERKVVAKINALYTKWFCVCAYDSLKSKSLKKIDILVTDVGNVSSMRKEVLLWETPAIPLDWELLSIEITNKLIDKLSERRNLIGQV